MPRRKTAFIAGEYYHLYNRGNNSTNTFIEKSDYVRFTGCIRDYLLPAATMLAYCLMPTHYHFLVQARKVPQEASTAGSELASALSHAMMRLSVSYTKWFNGVHGRTGVLFEGAFGSKRIRSTNQLMAITNYIHENPVAAGLADSAGDWPYSSFHSYVDAMRGNLVEVEPVINALPPGTDYAQYLADLRGPDSDLGGPIHHARVS